MLSGPCGSGHTPMRFVLTVRLRVGTANPQRPGEYLPAINSTPVGYPGVRPILQGIDNSLDYDNMALTNKLPIATICVFLLQMTC